MKCKEERIGGISKIFHYRFDFPVKLFLKSFFPAESKDEHQDAEDANRSAHQRN